MKEKICKNCLFWESDSVDFGYCEKLKDAIIVEAERHQIDIDLVGVPDIFGCNQFVEDPNDR